LPFGLASKHLRRRTEARLASTPFS
jgi:hypothetical protein